MKYNRVKDKDRGWNRIKREFSRSKDKEHVTVGIHEDQNTRGGDTLNNAEIGAVHEFGSQDGRVPERSFIRDTVSSKQHDYKKYIKALLQKVLAKHYDKGHALAILGERIKADIVNRINAGIEPGLADATLARKKGKHIPLIYTGQLKQSIDYEVHE